MFGTAEVAVSLFIMLLGGGRKERRYHGGTCENEGTWNCF